MIKWTKKDVLKAFQEALELPQTSTAENIMSRIRKIPFPVK